MPPMPPAVPFDSPTPRPTPRPIPVATPVPRPFIAPTPTATPYLPTPRPIPVATPVRRATPAPTPEPSAAPSPVEQKVGDHEGEIRFAPGQDDPANPASPDEVQLGIANGFFARKMYDSAAPEYEKYLGIYPNAPGRPVALFRLGEAYRILGNLNAAKNAYDTLTRSGFDSEVVGPGAYRLADLYYQEQNYLAALPLYRKASVRVKEAAIANAAKFYSGRCLEQLQQNTEARLVYQDLVETKNDNPFRDASRLSLAQLLIDAGRKAEALKQLQSLAVDGGNAQLRAEAMVRQGLLELDLELPDKAAATLTKALALPDIGKWKELAEVGLIRLQFQAGKFQEVIDTYAKGAAGFSPAMKPEVMLLAANANRQLGQHPAARALYDQLLKDFPDSAFAREAEYERLVSFYAADDPALFKEVDAYLAKNPKSTRKDQALLLKAESYFKKADYANAAPVYASLDRSKLAASLRAEALFKLGWSLVQTKSSEKAVAAFSTFLDENPSHKLAASALVQRGVAWQQSKQLVPALKDFETVITKYPKARERELALQQKALILGQQQDNPGMADTFRQLLRDFPKSTAAAQAHYWIGWAAFEGKDYKTAAAELAAARAADPKQFGERASLRIILSHFYLEDREELAKEVDAYAKSNPKGKIPVEVPRWLADAYYKAADFPSAEKFYALITSRDDASEAAPTDWLNLGRSQLAEKKWEAAIDTLTHYLTVAPDPVPHATGLLALGEAQLGFEKTDAADQSAADALKLQPEGTLNAQARILSAKILMARGKFDDALKVLQAVAIVMDDPDITPQALELAIEAARKVGKDPEAAKILNELKTRYPEYKLSAVP